MHFLLFPVWKEYYAEYWLKELLESMDRCTGRRDVTEILLKTAINTLQYLFFPFSIIFLKGFTSKASKVAIMGLGTKGTTDSQVLPESVSPYKTYNTPLNELHSSKGKKVTLCLGESTA